MKYNIILEKIDYLYGCMDVFSEIDNKINSVRDKWRQSEIENLIKLFPDYGIKKTAEFLGRPENSVASKAYKLGLLYNALSENDKEIVKKYYGKYSLEFIKSNFNIHASKKNIREFANANNLGRAYQGEWSKDEDNIIKDLYNKVDINELEKILNRTKISIRSRASKLGLTYKKQYKYVRKNGNYYCVRMFINGINKYWGGFKTEADAGIFAIKMAKKYGKVV